MDRLFNATVSLIYEDAHGKQFVTSQIADRGEFWWDAKRPDQSSLWDSKIELGEKFFHEIIAHPIPLDMNILKTMKRSSLGLDLYLWLTYRTFNLTRPRRLSWKQLYCQFGSNQVKANDPNTVNSFRTECLRELKKITSVEQWSDTREEFEASTYIRRPLGTIRVAAAGTFRIVASVLPAATYPTVISEAVARLFSYREAYKPRRNTGELADGTPPSTTGSFLRSGAAECLRFIRTPGI